MARDAEAVADLLRLLGPLTTDEIGARAGGADVGGWLEGLCAAKRVLPVSFAGRSWWVAIEDIGRLRDGVGVAVPVGVPASFTEAVADPLGELLGRYARTHAPFTTADVATRFGLGLRVAADVLGRLAADGQLVRGEFTADATGDQWCDADVLRILRRRSLAALRAQVEPVSACAYARFLPAWHHVGSTNSGIDGLAAVLDQLAGVPLPASAVESLVLAPRVRDYSPAMLDELLASGEVIWSGAGPISGSDGWIAFHLADSAPLTLAAPSEIEFAEPIARSWTRWPAAARFSSANSVMVNSKRRCGNWFGPARSPEIRLRPFARCCAEPDSGPPPLTGTDVRPGSAATASLMPRPARPTRPRPGAGRRCRHPNPIPPCGPTTKPNCC